MDDDNQQESEEKECPQCAELVKARARICRFCQHDFEAIELEPIVCGDKDVYCKACDRVTYRDRITPGYFWLEFLLWCCGILPGFFYTIWRHCSKYDACRNCKSRSVVRANSL